MGNFDVSTKLRPRVGFWNGIPVRLAGARGLCGFQSIGIGTGRTHFTGGETEAHKAREGQSTDSQLQLCLRLYLILTDCLHGGYLAQIPLLQGGEMGGGGAAMSYETPSSWITGSLLCH